MEQPITMTVRLPPNYNPSDAEEFMNPMQVEYFRERLEKARADLQRELDAVPRAEADEGSRAGDQADHASAGEEREFERLNRERVSILLRQTEQAIVRLENGTYGYCADTGEPIGLKRLMAQPSTSLSLEAQEERERRAG
jgi:DnaK suppressor protein